MSLFGEKIKYPYRAAYNWIIPPQVTSEIISADSIKDKEIEKLKAENEKLKKLVEFLRTEVRSLELKTALSERAIPLKNIVDEFTSTPEGKTAWEKAWRDQFNEWEELVRQGKMSKIKYHRLINGINQKTLAEKLGTAQPNITRIERIGYKPRIDTLNKLARIFGVKMEDLISD